ncbi:MAG: hypothetical protein ACE5MG_06460 [Candidatus Methylomirabilales bacterium]
MRSVLSRVCLIIILVVLLLLGATWAGVQKWADTGIVAAVTVESRTVVVEIPREADTLTVGAEVLPDAVLKAEGRTIDLGDIQVEDRVSIEWSRREHGNVVHKIVVIERAPR